MWSWLLPPIYVILAVATWRRSVLPVFLCYCAWSILSSTIFALQWWTVWWWTAPITIAASMLVTVEIVGLLTRELAERARWLILFAAAIASAFGAVWAAGLRADQIPKIALWDLTSLTLGVFTAVVAGALWARELLGRGFGLLRGHAALWALYCVSSAAVNLLPATTPSGWWDRRAVYCLVQVGLCVGWVVVLRKPKR